MIAPRRMRSTLSLSMTTAPTIRPSECLITARMEPHRARVLLLVLALLMWGAIAASEPPPASIAPSDPQGDPISAEDATAIAAIMHQAEGLGLPSLNGATFFSGAFRLRDRPANLWFNRDKGVHARLADGSWLVDLVDPVSAADLDPAVIAALHVVAAPMRVAPSSRFQQHAYLLSINLALIDARRVEAGFAGAGAVLAQHFSSRGAGYQPGHAYAIPPRVAVTGIRDGVRMLVSDWFIARYRSDSWDERWKVAAAGIAPEVRQRQISNDAERMHRLAIEPSDGDLRINTLRSWWLCRDPVDNPPTTEVLANDAVVDLAGDLRPGGPNGETIGDLALTLLGKRLGLNLEACFGRDPLASWDDAQQAAVAADVQRWWQAGAGMAMKERVATAAATMRTPALVKWMAESAVDGQEADPQRPVAASVPPALRALVAQQLAAPPTGITPADLLQFLNRFKDDTAITAAVAGWPRSGDTLVLLADWDDVHGRHDALDGLARQWVQDPLKDRAMIPAVAALIPCWWLSERPSQKRLERTSRKIERAQRRNAVARKCHTKRTRRRLHALGIKLTELPRCRWDST